RAPETPGEYRLRLLAKHLTTVEQFREELLDRRNNPAPNTLPREIPEPLYPGEKLQSYTQKFEQWLAQRGRRLSAMDGDPSQERGFWFSFAYLRVGECGAQP
ncbi:hypothetical protein PHYSODRAFT_429404, partial [Phytophthora sojae]